MNEELNLVEILKNVPVGTKLYSSVHGCVEFLSADLDYKGYPIKIRYDNKIIELSDAGELYYRIGECILFPSKDQRDWSKFKVDLHEGTKVMCSDGKCWCLRYYAYNKSCYEDGDKSGSRIGWNYIVPVTDFDFENIESNINKSI